MRGRRGHEHRLLGGNLLDFVVIAVVGVVVRVEEVVQLVLLTGLLAVRLGEVRVILIVGSEAGGSLDFPDRERVFVVVILEKNPFKFNFLFSG